ncbi:MAG: NUDIX hydrolase [Gammaproteobacteria bacterium]
MDTKPLGNEIDFCPACGEAVSTAQPDGDNKLRYVCTACNAIHYENPKIVVGCVPEFKGRILLCKRDIEPRRHFWTVPAGFMELGETLDAGAARETREEACAEIEIGELLAVVDVVHARQVHVFFTASMISDAFAAGEETSDARLFTPADIPWDEIAFPSGTIALKEWLKWQESGEKRVCFTSAPRIPAL